MPRVLDQALLQRIAGLYNEGKKYTEIMAETKQTISVVRGYVRKAKDAGLAPERRTPTIPASRPKHIVRASGHKFGNITDMLLLMDEKILHWVLQQLPQGASVTDFAAQCVIDAYYEENEE